MRGRIAVWIVLVDFVYIHLVALNLYVLTTRSELVDMASDTEIGWNTTGTTTSISVASNGTIPIETWWYERMQENQVETIVHEYKDTFEFQQQFQLNSNININNNNDNQKKKEDTSILNIDLFHLLQPNRNTSMIVQFYSSDATDCPEECMYLRHHYMHLALRMDNITTTTTTAPPSVMATNSDTDTDTGISHHDSKIAATSFYNESVSFHVVNCVNHRMLCQHQHITYYPTIRVYKKNHDDDSSSKSRSTHNAYTDISYQHLHPYEVLEKLGMMAHYDVNKNTHHLNHNIMKGTNDEELHQYPYRSGEEIFHDVHVALGELLRTVVFSIGRRKDHARYLQSHVLPPTSPTSTKKHKSDLSITEQEVLKAFLLLLHKVLPANTYNVGVQGMIKGIIDNFTYAVKNQNYMNVIMNKYHPVPTRYSNHTCSTTSINNNTINEGNKYTCAMWDVLLLMSIGIVDYNIQSYDATEMIHPASALHTIFEFVQIFGMSSTITTPSSSSSSSSNHTLDDSDTVRTQFLDVYNDCTFLNRCQKLPNAPKFIYNNNKDQVSKEYIAQITTTYEEWIFLPLYISTIRNMTSSQSDLSSIHIWPPISVCVVCWKVEANEKSSSLTYDETNMYKYLKLVYGRIEAITTTYQTDLFNESIITFKERQASIISLTNQILKQNKIPSLPRQHFVNMDGLKSLIHATTLLVRPQSTSNTILSLRRGSLCILFLMVTVLRWIYRRRGPKGVAAMPQSKLYGRIFRLPQAILHTFRGGESNLAPRKMLSPRKRRILNRRFAIEQENEKSRRPPSRQSSFRLDQLEASKCADGDRNNESLDTIIFTSIPTSPPSLPLECKNSTSNKNISCIPFDTMQQLRQRKPSHAEPVVKM